MANIRKSFNLRNGVQVDDDNFIVNPNGLVGIGTTVPEETLDVRGSIRVSGILSTNNLLAGNIQTINALNAGITSITSGIITATSGVVTYYGDGSKLLNLPTSQWIDIDVGLGFTSIYAQGFVGVGTVDPRYLFQVGGNNDLNDFQTGVGINRTGDIVATGIITASTFSGSGSALSNLNASNITSGTISVDRLPIIPEPKLPDSFQVAGIITALGGFSGVAFTAANLVPEARVDIQHVASQTAEIGISTVSTRLAVEGRIGVNTNSPQSDIHIVGGSSAALQVTATQSSVLVGRGLNPTQNTGGLKFGNTSGLYPYSNTRTLDIINYGTGNVNYYVDYSISGSIDSNFNWLYGPDSSNPLMTLNYQGNLGLGITNPTSRLQVSGNVTASSLNVTGSVVATGAGSSTSVRTLYVLDGASGLLDGNGNLIIDESNSNVYVTSGVSTFFDINVTNKSTHYDLQVTNNGIFNERIGIANTQPSGELHIGNPLLEDVRQTILITRNGIGIGTDDLSNVDANLYALDGGALFGSVGIGTTSVDPTESNPNLVAYVNGDTFFAGNVSVSGIITATSFIGNGSGLTGISTFSGDYGDLTNAPTNLSDFSNDVGFITSFTDTNYWNKTTAGIHTLSNVGIGTTNPTSALTVSGDTLISGVTTSTGGFTSGIGTAVEITTVGDQLIFTVPGVGTTSLTLF
jgi:hypothetical protein